MLNTKWSRLNSKMFDSLQLPINELKGVRKSKSLERLNQAGMKKVEDLLWVLPLRLQKTPEITTFDNGNPDELFMGIGEIVSFDAYPNRRVRGKGGVTLQNISVTVKDYYSNEHLMLKWFNSYPSIAGKLSKSKFIEFEGVLSSYRGSFQVMNPKFNVLEEDDIPSTLPEPSENPGVKIQYPTINGVDSKNFKRFIDKLPNEVWNISEYLPDHILDEVHMHDLPTALKIIHGQVAESLEPRERDLAKRRLVYEEFLREQIMILSRREIEKKPESPVFNITDDQLKKHSSLFPYELTTDQKSSLEDIQNDLALGHPMMRMIQGDVGCGKTTVAAISAISVLDNGYQVALMCPTESLALQHFRGLEELIKNSGHSVGLLVGSLTPKEKSARQQQLAAGEIDFVIGTHALFQDSVSFKKLGFVIIDEQHKFGVDQRLKLVSKGEGTHCLTMTATPIPRSLSLTQYGDLDLSVIKTMPAGRKGIKTRIVNPENFQNFLTFINTRIGMKEQVYIVVPAITENPEMDIVNLENVHKKFTEIFPQHRILALHGQQKPEEKNEAYTKFAAHEVDILISTSVIEVGINVPNATVMAIMNPDRFGLSSLHQLRGRVGRGDKPGFCFLVNDKRIGPEAEGRLEILEKTNDGFVIAEEDLKNRGQGNIFGKEQSGSEEYRKVANIIEHQDILFTVKEDISKLQTSHPEIIEYLSEVVSKDQRVFSTI
jgi:ATP-dependent DNA helicase RecG